MAKRQTNEPVGPDGTFHGEEPNVSRTRRSVKRSTVVFIAALRSRLPPLNLRTF